MPMCCRTAQVERLSMRRSRASGRRIVARSRKPDRRTATTGTPQNPRTPSVAPTASRSFSPTVRSIPVPGWTTWKIARKATTITVFATGAERGDHESTLRVQHTGRDRPECVEDDLRDEEQEEERRERLLTVGDRPRRCTRAEHARQPRRADHPDHGDDPESDRGDAEQPRSETFRFALVADVEELDEGRYQHRRERTRGEQLEEHVGDGARGLKAVAQVGRAEDRRDHPHADEADAPGGQGRRAHLGGRAGGPLVGGDLGLRAWEVGPPGASAHRARLLRGVRGHEASSHGSPRRTDPRLPRIRVGDAESADRPLIGLRTLLAVQVGEITGGRR